MSIISWTCEDFLFLARSIFSSLDMMVGLLSHSEHLWRVWVNFDKFQIFGTGWLFLEIYIFSGHRHLQQ
jgi:hypothetical protein